MRVFFMNFMYVWQNHSHSYSKCLYLSHDLDEYSASWKLDPGHLKLKLINL